MIYSWIECPDCWAEFKKVPAAIRDCEEFGEPVNSDDLCFDHYQLYIGTLPDTEEE
jgi:hypothetical protein